MIYTEDKSRLNIENRQRRLLLRFSMGCKSVITNKWKACVVVAYIVIAILFRFNIGSIFHFTDTGLFNDLYKNVILAAFPFYALVGLFFVLVMLGTPWGGSTMSDNLWRIGLSNRAGESPMLLARYKDKCNPNITVLEFDANGISKPEWEDKHIMLEAALNLNIVKISNGKNKKRILLYTVSARNSLPQWLDWKDEYLKNDDCTLILGESLIGRVTVNLTQIPHILLGGSTGSGKSILLKLLLMQCVKKGAVVYIADFKGGVDFPPEWHSKCEIITDEERLLQILTVIVEELEHRKEMFRYEFCANIGEYNRKSNSNLHRIIFACDEVAEVLDKTGLSKEDKELVGRIESKLSIIARQGRAFGIHLILATQRPDANILTGQIRNNIDYRICGRADNVLSQIILDSTDAADQIPKDAQGRFLTHDGTLFQGYMFDDRKAFDGMRNWR